MRIAELPPAKAACQQDDYDNQKHQAGATAAISRATQVKAAASE